MSVANKLLEVMRMVDRYRYNVYPMEMVKEEDGDYVKYDDYEKSLKSKLEVSMMNKWEKIAKIVGEENGIELGLNEEFEIASHRFNPYKFTGEGLCDCDNNIYFAGLGKLIEGHYQIKKLPRKPKLGEWYCIPDFTEDDLISEYEWRDDPCDNNFFNVGIVRFAKEEAIALAKKMLEVAKGDKI